MLEIPQVYTFVKNVPNYTESKPYGYANKSHVSIYIYIIFHKNTGIKTNQGALLQWNLSVSTTSIIKSIACDLFSIVF